MKITLTLLCGLLSERYGICSNADSIIDKSAKYRTVRLLTSERKDLDKELLYVCPRYPVQDQKAKGIIIIGLPQNKPNIENNEISIETELNYCEVYNLIIAIFDELTEWDYRMKQACYMPDAIEQILKIAQDELPHPMYVADSGFKIYAMSDHPEMCDLSYSWKYAYNQGYLPLDIIISLSENKKLRRGQYLNKAYIASSESFYTRFVNYIIAKEDTLLGHFFVIEMFKNFSEIEVELASIIGDTILYVLTNNTLINVISGTIFENFLYDVIDGTLTDTYMIKRQLEALKWSNVWKFCVLRLELDTDEKNILRSFCNVVEQKIRNTKAIVYDNGIAIIACISDRNNYRQFMIILELFLKKSNFCAGLSDTFEDFKIISIYYQQAYITLKLRRKNSEKKLIHYTDIAFAHLIQQSSDHVNVSLYIHPSIKDLKLVDEKEGTFFINTLYTYVMNDRAVGKTAEKLYLHRNTLMNRLEKIQSISGIDLGDYQTVKRLILSFEIMDSMNDINNNSRF